ncbi:hypothetical protein Tco_0750024 [Tanacetum coccineum]|uniref:Reverse transcriptase domain-containing protein n=1 Tax=Tanacetum coccineum TaxID=301880 RepID=A0ABQ4Z3R7_9ASTR
MSESPELSNECYVLCDHVMNPLTAYQEQKTRKDHGTRRGRHSTSSSSAFDQPSSSYINDDNDGNDEGTSYPDMELAIPLDEIQIDDKLHFIEEPVEIMDREVKRLKQSRIPIVKVRWNSRRGPEFTWEREDQMKKKYPHLFANPSSTS